MGEIVVAIELENPVDRQLSEADALRDQAVRSEKIDAVVDTGAVMLALPVGLVTRLGIPTRRTISTSYADGRRGELPVAGPLTIRIGNREMSTDCIVVPESAEALVGQVVMETLDLIPDPLQRTLDPRPESPDRPLLRV
ncbi:MAG: clan AA aspartic protease [Chloroflexi bacterium]|nr:clan AA aspartic protease [Chloroflexota bacterium]MCY3696645.1 clan AA aspartic protease [Chloroflexota bacterium]